MTTAAIRALSHDVTTHDTWGIPSRTFLGLYVALAIIAIAVPIALCVRRFLAPTPGCIQELSPSEAGMLVSDRNAVLAALAQLRVAGLIDQDGRPVRAITSTDRATLDLFTRSVFTHIEQGRTIREKDLSVALDQLRAGLVERGLMFRRPRLIGFPLLLAVTVLGVARILAGNINHKPTAYLIIVVVILIIATVLSATTLVRTTAPGAAAVRALQRQHSLLSPRLRPSLNSYGPTAAGFAGGLFGAGSLLALDLFTIGSDASEAASPIHSFLVNCGSGGSSDGGGGCGGGGGGGGCGGCGSGGGGGGGCGG